MFCAACMWGTGMLDTGRDVVLLAYRRISILKHVLQVLTSTYEKGLFHFWDKDSW